MLHVQRMHSMSVLLTIVASLSLTYTSLAAETDAQRIKLLRRRDHFLFSVESVGQYDAAEIVKSSISELKTKARVLKRHNQSANEVQDE